MSKKSKKITEEKVSNSHGTSTLQNRSNLWLYLIFAVLILIVFAPALAGQLVTWDDMSYLVGNEKMLKNMDLVKIFTTPSVMGNYHPLTMLTYSIVYQIAGFATTKYFHLINILLHILNTILVYRLSFKLTSEKKYVSIIVALLFAIHPFHVESVAWVSELKDVLYTSFWLLSILSFMKGYEKQDTKYYVFSILLFLGSCLSKGMAVTLPPVLVLILYFYYQEKNIKKYFSLIPFFVLALVIGIVAYQAQKSGQGLAALGSYSFLERFLFVCYSFVFYPLKGLLPLKLSIVYPYPRSGSDLSILYYIAPVFVILYFVLLWKSWRRYPLVALGLSIYAICILPVLQLLPVGESMVFERYYYVSSIGIFLAIVYAGNAVLLRFPSYRNYALGVLGVTMMYYAYSSYTRCQDWKDTLSLWGAVMRDYPEVDKSYYAYGEDFQAKGNASKAFEYYNKTIEKNPDNKKAYINLANCYITFNKDNQNAELNFKKALALDPNYSKALYGIGTIIYPSNQDSAYIYFRKAAQYEPTFQEAHYMLGMYFNSKQMQDSSQYYFRKAAELGYKPAQGFIKK